MHPSQYYPSNPSNPSNPPPTHHRPPWETPTPSPATADSPFQTYPMSHTLQRAHPQLTPFSHGSDAPNSAGALHSTSAAMWTAPATMPGPGAPGSSNPPYQSPGPLPHNYPPHLTSSGGRHLIGNPAHSALPYSPYPPRAMDAHQYAPLQGGSTGGSSGGGALRNQGARPSSSVVTRPAAGHPYVPHGQGAPPYSLRNRAPGMLPARRQLGSRTAKADDGSDGEYGDSDVDLEGPMKRTDGFGGPRRYVSIAYHLLLSRHNLSTHERRRLYVSALETYITDTTSTMRGHGLEPPPMLRCVDNRGLTSDARLVRRKDVYPRW